MHVQCLDKTQQLTFSQNQRHTSNIVIKKCTNKPFCEQSSEIDQYIKDKHVHLFIKANEFNTQFTNSQVNDTIEVYEYKLESGTQV